MRRPRLFLRKLTYSYILKSNMLIRNILNILIGNILIDPDNSSKPIAAHSGLGFRV